MTHYKLFNAGWKKPSFNKEAGKQCAEKEPGQRKEILDGLSHSSEECSLYVYRVHSLSKVHKPENPGRQIVSSCGLLTEERCKFTEYHFNQLVTKNSQPHQAQNIFFFKWQNFNYLPSGTFLDTLDYPVYTVS